MDLLKAITDKVTSLAEWKGSSGIESVLLHIQIAERHHQRARDNRDEHLYTDSIYRTNHAFEGILKEAYLTLAEKTPDTLTPYQIEEYLLENNILRGRVADLLKNYRQHWRNPSTHDHKLFFSEQESFLAIVSVSAFANILIDQMLEKQVFTSKYRSLGNEAKLARDGITNFSKLTTIDKVQEILSAYADHYIHNFETVSVYGRSSANAQLAAFIVKVAPELKVEQEVIFTSEHSEIIFDLVITDDKETVAVETRDSNSIETPRLFGSSDSAMNQLAWKLRDSNIKNGVLFCYPGSPDQSAITITNSTSWPGNIDLREIYGADPSEIPDDF